MAERRKSRPVRIGNKVIGGEHPILVQSMLKTPLSRFREALREAEALVEAGCEILRVATPNHRELSYLPELKKALPIPIVADIHFDLRLALRAVELGADKIRLNPGNTRSGPILQEIARACRERGVAIRLGVNVGSLPEEFYITYADDLPRAMVETALTYLRPLEEMGFQDIVISLKSSRVPDMIAAYRRMADLVPYPFHLGVTEAGLGEEAVIKSAIGIGTLLAEGIGDTIRVSLAESSVREVQVGFAILKALGLREKGFDLIACPTCGRVRIQVEELAERVRAWLARLPEPDKVFRVAVMGCEVNGPGESRMADLGLAGGPTHTTIYFRGEKVARVRNEELEEFVFRFLREKLNGQPEHRDSGVQ